MSRNNVPCFNSPFSSFPNQDFGAHVDSQSSTRPLRLHLGECLLGMRDMFDHLLPCKLLYKSERKQHKVLVEDKGKKSSEVGNEQFKGRENKYRDKSCLHTINYCKINLLVIKLLSIGINSDLFKAQLNRFFKK